MARQEDVAGQPLSRRDQAIVRGRPALRAAERHESRFYGKSDARLSQHAADKQVFRACGHNQLFGHDRGGLAAEEIARAAAGVTDAGLPLGADVVAARRCRMTAADRRRRTCRRRT